MERLRDRDTRRVALEAMTEIAHLADARASIEERAQAVANALRPVVPFEGSWIAVLDPERVEHVTMLSDGYDRATDGYLRSVDVLEDIEMVGATRSAIPVCLRRLPFPPHELRVWADYLAPAGFVDAVGAGLFSRDRYVGMLALHTDTTAHPTDEALALIRLLSPLIARALDPLRSVSATAELVLGAKAGIVLNRDGRSAPIPGLEQHHQLHDGTPLRQVVDTYLVAGRGQITFLSPDAMAAPLGYHRVTLLPCDAQEPFHLVAAVALSEVHDLRGLTPTDVTILGLLDEGSSRAQAAALGITPRLIDERMPRITATLHTPTRAQAVSRAVRLGVFVPPALATVRDPR
jgi:hypothetical protein